MVTMKTAQTARWITDVVSSCRGSTTVLPASLAYNFAVPVQLVALHLLLLLLALNAAFNE